MSPPPVDPATAAEVAVAVEAAWRQEWGRLLALLVARFGRLDLAEDGLAEAFEAAARTWGRDGLPAQPAAWLMTTARRRVLDRMRAEAVAARVLPTLAVDAALTEKARGAMDDPARLVEHDDGRPQEELLRLVLLCAHPALSPESAAALTLRLVLGVPTADIARLFLVSTPTMAARLTRARKRLAGERFEVPAGALLTERTATVAEVAYLAFTAGYAPGSGDLVVRAALSGEAIRLVRVVRRVLPEYAELDALLALLLLQHARRDARVDEAGELVLLADQERERWHHDEIAEGLAILERLIGGPATPYLLQAMIAAEHAVAPTAEATAWPRIADRYAELEALTGSSVVRLNRAVAVAEADGPLAGLALLAGLDLPGHRLPATRGELLLRAGRPREASEQLTLAVERCDHQAERRHLARRLASARAAEA